MKDAQGNLVLGRTRWRRFAAVIVPAVAAAGVLMAGVATGAVPASFAVSGSTFKVTATHLHGTGFVQYGGVAYPKGGKTITLPDGTVIGDPTDPNNHAIAVSGIKDATLNNLCQSVVVAPGHLSLVIHAGQDPNHPVHATDLLIGMTSLSGDATFTNTLAWRLCHIADLLDARRNGPWLGVPAILADRDGDPGTAADALAVLRGAHDVWRRVLDSTTDEGLAEPIGEVGGPFADSTRRAFVLHVLDELIHHGAEVALLRDLYRAWPG